MKPGTPGRQILVTLLWTVVPVALAFYWFDTSYTGRRWLRLYPGWIFGIGIFLTLFWARFVAAVWDNLNNARIAQLQPFIDQLARKLFDQNQTLSIIIGRLQIQQKLSGSFSDEKQKMLDTAMEILSINLAIVEQLGSGQYEQKWNTIATSNELIIDLWVNDGWLDYGTHRD